MIARGIKGRAVLFSEMTPAEGDEVGFNVWYDTHHMPSHVRGVPGFVSGQRYRSDSGPHYLAIYELESPDTLESEEYRSRKYTPGAATKAMLESVSGFTRYIAVELDFKARYGSEGDPLDSEIVLAEFFELPDEQWSAFIDWHVQEQTPILLTCPQWKMIRHLEIIDYDPEPFTHMILHYVDDMSVLTSAELAEARATTGYEKFAAQPWFHPLMVPYRRHGDRVRKGG